MNPLLNNEETLYEYLERHAKQNALHQTSIVLPYARQMHKGQYRKGKEKIPYICHPLMVAYHGLALGFEDDTFLSAALLHDVCEDCNVAIEDLPVDEETKHIVALLTKEDTPKAKTEEGQKAYYSSIAKNPYATIIKLLDRCNNVSGMAAGFGKEKMMRYIKETEQWFYPLIAYAKKEYSVYENQIFLIEYQIRSVIESIKQSKLRTFA